MQEQVGPGALFRNLKDDLPYLIEKMPEMPGLVYKSLKAVADGQFQLKHVDEMKKIRHQLQQNHRRSAYVTSGSAALIAAAIIYALADSAPLTFGAPLLAWLAAGCGMLLISFGLRR